MMLATPFYSQPFYTPLRASPLSERSANVVSHPFSFTMASPMQNGKDPVVPQRAYKANPIIQTRDAATKRRRDMFFRRVQKDRDDKKWDGRGEQIQRLDFISDHKRWEAEKAREAALVEDEFVEEEILDESSYAQRSAPEPEQEMDEADYILAQEEHELQELISSMEEEQETASQHYGSDDDDYDEIFMECTSTAEIQQSQQQPPHVDPTFNDNDAMDMS